MDVALLYRKDRFQPLNSQALDMSSDSLRLITRDVLYVKGLLAQNDTLHFFVNHWPSKYGGATKSRPKRIYVAHQVKAKTDSILKTNNQASIVVMGDLNAEIEEPSVKILMENPPRLHAAHNYNRIGNKIGGTHKYKGQWAIIDHVFVSESLHHQLQQRQVKCEIVDLPFILEEDKTYSGVKPFRTYYGPRYNGGVSDHLPVLLSW